MALNKEIWVSDIKNQLLPDNSFVTKGTDYSAFADNHEIHIPVELGGVNVEIDRKVLPGQVTATSDNEASIFMHNFTTDPVRVYRPEDIELSYDKRAVIVKKIADSVNGKIASCALGAIRAAGIYGKLSGANAKVLSEVRDIALQFDQQDYPDADRYMLLSADTYSKLLKELTDSQANAFLSVANAETGVLGKLFGINILKRSSLNPEYIVAPDAPDSDSEANPDYLAWHKRDYMFALGKTEVYTQENAPEYYGTVISASVRFGAFGNGQF